MRTRAAVSAALASAGILLAGWQSGAHVADTGSTAARTAAGRDHGGAGDVVRHQRIVRHQRTSGSAVRPARRARPAPPGPRPRPAGRTPARVVQTRFGTVQVQITVKAGQITDVTALQLTDDDRKSVQISNRAAPLLRAEVLQAQSAEVQTISGATVTSDAYLTSLQAALDAANL